MTITGGCWRFALLTLTTALVALSPAIEVHDAQAASYTPCMLSEHDQDPPGGTPAYNLFVTRKGASCTVAKKVMLAFHRCRTEGRSSCAKTVLGSWRCAGRKAAILPLGQPRVSDGQFTCASGRRRVRGTYQENSPKCFGAAARDSKRPCVNSTRTVFPRGDDPHPFDEGAAGCHDDETHACVFGVPPEAAKGHFAVVGDSHVFHWRAALSTIARAHSWRGYSHSAGGCFFSEAAALFSQGCGDWYRSTAAWFTAHPEVTMVFVTANADTPVGVGPGETIRDVKVDGFKRAFQALPKSVRHIIVLRDTPASTQETFDCLGPLIAAGTQGVGEACALARTVGLREDTAVLAARELRSERYGVIDMTRYFCDARNCYPVIGGVLVNGDIFGHIIVSYMKTVGPYLMREFRKLSTGWKDAS